MNAHTHACARAHAHIHLPVAARWRGHTGPHIRIWRQFRTHQRINTHGGYISVCMGVWVGVGRCLARIPGVYTHTYIYVYIYVHMWVYIYIYINIDIKRLACRLDAHDAVTHDAHDSVTHDAATHARTVHLFDIEVATRIKFVLRIYIYMSRPATLPLSHTYIIYIDI